MFRIRILVAVAMLAGGSMVPEVKAVTCGPAYDNIGGVCVPKSSTVGNLSDKPVLDIFDNFMGWLIGVTGLLAIFGFILSAIFYFTAAGDEDRLKRAKQAFWYSIIGTFIALGAFMFITVIDNFLKAGTI